VRRRPHGTHSNAYIQRMPCDAERLLLASSPINGQDRFSNNESIE
jgi:hypothetical protein